MQTHLQRSKHTAAVSILSGCFSQEMCEFNLHSRCFFTKLTHSECFILGSYIFQSDCHRHVQHGPQPLPSGHPNLLAGDRELWGNLSTDQQIFHVFLSPKPTCIHPSICLCVYRTVVAMHGPHVCSFPFSATCNLYYNKIHFAHYKLSTGQDGT